MIGNAVPVQMARFVADRLQGYINNIANAGGVVLNDRQAFSEWLRATKGYSDRSISDVFSRINRANLILPNHNMDHYFIPDLDRNAQFNELETSVRSQIRKAIRLKLAYLEQLPHRNIG